MRSEANKALVEQFLRELGTRTSSHGRVYLTGGGTAVIEGWRVSTIDVDLKAVPEPEGFFEAIATLKDELNINVELAAPDDFIPPLPGWQERSPFIGRHGKLDFHHYDLYSQALAKIERSHARDLDDVAALFERNLVDRETLLALFKSIEPEIIRYPAIDPAAFRAAVLAACVPAER